MMINRKNLFIIIFGIIVVSISALTFFQFILKKEIKPPEITPILETIPPKTTLTSYTNDILGVIFQYPSSWGGVQAKEDINLNYLFPSYPPEQLIVEFTERRLSNDFITTFKSWDSKKQLEYLIKDRIGYEKFLNKKLIISFSKNEHIKITAFNKNYVDFSGYECAVPISPVYKGNLVLNENVCFSPELFSQIKVKNFYIANCKFLPNKLIIVPGTFEEDDCVFDKESAFLIAVANLKQNKEYTGLLIEYFYKSYENLGAKLMNSFGYSGYGTEEEKIKEINIAACNALIGGSAASTETFSKYFDRIINDALIQDFVSFISSKLDTLGINSKIKSLVVRKHQEELAKNKGKKFIDYRDGKNFCMCFDATGDILEKINNLEDIEKYFSQMNPNDINCAVYKINKKQNLDAFCYDSENNPQLLEFQSFIKSVTIK